MFAPLNRLSIRNRIWSIVAIFIGSVLLTSVIDVTTLRNALHQDKEGNIRQLVENAHSVLAHYQELERSGSLSRAAAQAMAIATIKGMRYNGKDYFWLNDNQTPPRMVMHPISPELDGQPLLGDKFNCVTSMRNGTEGPFVPTDGKKNLLQAFTELVAQTGHGYVTYPWPKVNPDGKSTQDRFPKLSYVKGFAPWGWTVGSGIYIDDIDAAVHARAIQHLFHVLGIASALLLLASLIAGSITAPLKATMRAMHDIAHGNAGLDQRLAVEGRSEIAELAGNFNDMLDHIERRDEALLKQQAGLEQEVSRRTASLREANRQLDAELAERKRIEKIISAGKSRMHALLDATDEAVMLLAPDATVLEINAFAARRFGRTPQQMIGTNFLDHMPAELAKTRGAMMRAAVASGDIVRFQDQRGSTWFDNNLFPVKDEGGVIESVAVFAKDISEQKRVQMDEELFLQLGTVLMRWGVDSRAIAQIFCDGILPMFNLDAACIVVIGKDGLLSLAATAGNVARTVIEDIAGSGNEGPACQPLAELMASGRHQVVHIENESCPLCVANPQAPSARTAILLPLKIHGEHWGVLALYGKEPDQFDDSLLQQRLLASANRLVITLESALRQERLALFDLALAEVGNAVMITDAESKIIWVNHSFSQLSGYTNEELHGQPPRIFNSGTQDAVFFRHFWESISGGNTWRGDIVNRRKDGSLYTASQMVTPLFNAEGKISHYIAVLEDISERKRQELELKKNYEHLRVLNEQLENAQNQLLQSEKMASIGQLAAGVAHEINNPIGFVNSNLGTLKNYVDELLNVIHAYSAADPLLAGHPEFSASIAARKAEADLDFLGDDIQSLIKESREGIARVTRIVQDLKDFSRIDSMDWAEANLEQGLDSTLNIAMNEIKFKADIVKEYAGIPDIECLGSQLNQVFMNLLVNAAHAIETRGTITIRTGRTDDAVWVEIADTGRGIPPENLKRIFDPFFTTKAVGKGTGLGLSLAYSIVQKHHGKLDVSSKVGVGSCFRVEIPVRQPAPAEASSVAV
ncbi:MAG: cache domain-containing protein [Gammaproteobacteria bacterium]|nr:cache domain-containing protein [Gammaproteobacteria bacterium]MBU1603326.1 cache domain-containing protein [Gammaproteobacteria bacterium]MBU2432846.1 cache domain-containing protein [Gammaproteobacteria bacterium]MBU2450089.1 cache domain-containing protein [Gammaproteobacteria bacterium]